MNIYLERYRDMEMTPCQLSQELSIPLADLEPFILETTNHKYSCSVYGFYQWVTGLIQEHTFEELHEKTKEMVILLIIITNDTLAKEILPEDVMKKLVTFVDMELEYVFKD